MIVVAVLGCTAWGCDSPDPMTFAAPQFMENLGVSCPGMTAEECAAVRHAIWRMQNTPDPACQNIGYNLSLHENNGEIVKDSTLGNGPQDPFSYTYYTQGNEYHGYSIYLGPKAFVSADELYDTLAHEGSHHKGFSDAFAWDMAADCLAMAPA